MKKDTIFINTFLTFLFLSLYSCSFNIQICQGSQIKKYGMIASTSEIIYYSFQRLNDTIKYANPTNQLLDNGKPVPKGGIIQFEIHLPGYDTAVSKLISYKVVSSDGKIIRKRIGGRYDQLIEKKLPARAVESYGNKTPQAHQPAGSIGMTRTKTLGGNTFIYHNSLHIESPVNGPFYVYITDNGSKMIKNQRYKVTPDIEK